MPKDKDLKRLARERMQKTGESYTAARSQLVQKKNPLPNDYAKLAGMSDDSVRAKTGKTWKQWTRELDDLGGTSMEHRAIADHVHENFDVSGWWAQTVTVGYERIRGLREVGQRRGGGYDVNKSKTIAAPVDTLFDAFATDEVRVRWLPDVEIEIRKATRGKSMRITWEDGTPVEAYFTAKGDAKSAVSIQHRKQRTKEDAERLKSYWAERLGALADVLTGVP